MSDDIFDNGQQTPPANVEPPKAPELPDPLKELVGEGKKYASVDKALESIPHAQKHIEQLENELKELRDKVGKATATEEVYKTVQELLAQNKATPNSPALDEAQIAALLDRKLTERESQAIAKRNVESVKNALESKFGDKAKEVYNKKAEELGVPVSFLNDVVAKSPNAAFELFGLKNGSAPAPTPTKGGVNTEAFKQPASQPRKSVMGGATTSDMVAAWRASKPE